MVKYSKSFLLVFHYTLMACCLALLVIAFIIEHDIRKNARTHVYALSPSFKWNIYICNFAAHTRYMIPLCVFYVFFFAHSSFMYAALFVWYFWCFFFFWNWHLYWRNQMLRQWRRRSLHFVYLYCKWEVGERKNNMLTQCIKEVVFSRDVGFAFRIQKDQLILSEKKIAVNWTLEYFSMWLVPWWLEWHALMWME